MWSTLRVHAEAEGRMLRLKEFWNKIIFHTEIGGHVLIPFFVTCQSIGQAADEEMGRRKNKRGRGAHWAFWARKGVAAGGAEGKSQQDCNTPNPLNSHLTCLAKKKNIVWDFVAGTLLE